METLELLQTALIEAGKAIRSKLFKELCSQQIITLSEAVAETQEDTIYYIDKQVEEPLVETFSKYSKDLGGLEIIAEGISATKGKKGLWLTENGTAPTYSIIIDPIDGTRGLMYNKRAGFYIAGAAYYKPNGNFLSDIFCSALIELPTSKMLFSDCITCFSGKGIVAFRENMYSGEVSELKIQPSKAKTLIGGFAQLARFCPPNRGLLADIDDELIFTLYPEYDKSKAQLFEDQYISTGGQLYEVLMGHDRFIADIRNRINKHCAAKKQALGYTCHPYDAGAFLIAKEAGCIITDSYGQPFEAPMDLLTEIGWVLYANTSLYESIKPVFQKILNKRLLA